jgi:hypothetical protein
MGKIMISTNVSLDGVVQDPGLRRVPDLRCFLPVCDR